MDWIELARDSQKWRDLVNAVMKLQWPRYIMLLSLHQAIICNATMHNNSYSLFISSLPRICLLHVPLTSLQELYTLQKIHLITRYLPFLNSRLWTFSMRFRFPLLPIYDLPSEVSRPPPTLLTRKSYKTAPKSTKVTFADKNSRNRSC